MADTEQNLADFSAIETWADDEILNALVGGQERAVAAVRHAIPQISRAASVLAAGLAAGGKLYYAGAGTSIRVAVQDGTELPATFGMPEDRLGYLIAGGRTAMFETLADAEDDVEAGRQAAKGLNSSDTVIAVAASGTTPYTVEVAKRAREIGAIVIAVVNNPGSPLGNLADHEILLNSGAEVIAGSTRMGAGTAQKAALNLLSTLTHIKLGAVHDGMMVNVQADNIKLKKRAKGIVSRIAGVDNEAAATALETSKGEVKPAILLCSGMASIDEARQKLLESNGNLRRALESIGAA